MQSESRSKIKWIIRLISIYRMLWLILSPLWLTWLGYRIYKGKENLHRISERFGFASSSRPAKNIIWIHAASVGESKIALNLASKLSTLYPNYNILITNGTVTSASLVEKQKPEGAIQQYIPLDEYFSLKRFFSHWKPQLGIILESEIWPNLLDVGALHCPIVLVNAILSDKSYNRWMGHRSIARYCFSKFSKILCQSSKDEIKYSMLSTGRESTDSIVNLGNLKFASPKPSVCESKLEMLRASCGIRPIVLAASTHEGDEDWICQMHIELKKQYPDLLTIIAPRHIKRAESIKQLIKSYKMIYMQRSNDEVIAENTDVYLADTMGELGIFFSLARITIMGGSFKNGGHNPIEPAFFDTHIIFGPDMSNFKEVSREFLEHKAATQIFDINELIALAAKLLKTEPTGNAKKVLANHDQIMSNYINILGNYLTKDHPELPHVK